MINNNIIIKVIKINTFWDSEGKVWVATSNDLPGLVTEASSNEILIEKLKVIIAELLDLNVLSIEYP